MTTMSRTAWILAGLLLAWLALGCADATCEKICDACTFGSDNKKDCKEECKADYNDGNSDCKKAMRDWADCVDEDGCDTSCNDEGADVLDECDIDINDYL